MSLPDGLAYTESRLAVIDPFGTVLGVRHHPQCLDILASTTPT
jgi:hypothetical protein